MLSKRLLLFLLWFSNIMAGVYMAPHSELHRQYDLRPEWINPFLHRASTFALFHSKAKKVLQTLPAAEHVIYENCYGVAKTALHLAKCVRDVLEARDRLKAEASGVTVNSCAQVMDADGNWLNQMLRWVYNNVFCREAAEFRRVFNVSQKCGTPRNVVILKDVQGFFDKMNTVIRYTYKVTKGNEKFLRDAADVDVSFRSRAPDGKSSYEELSKIVAEMEMYDDKGVVSYLSPKLFNLLPEPPLDPDSKRILSPSMLSFQDEGMIPLPKLFRLTTSNDCDTLKWMDLLLDITGGSTMLRMHVQQFSDQMRTVDSVLFPRIQRMEAHDQLVDDVNSLADREQRAELTKFGYTRMNDEQLELINEHRRLHNDDHFMSLSTEEDLEEVIRTTAKLTPADLERQSGHEGESFKVREKRQARRPSIFDFRFLDPFAFVSRINNPNFLGNYVVSPFAFYLQVFSPYMLGMDIMSPRVFIATIFSPVVLVLRVLAPTSFRLMLFSPLLLTAWIITPEALLAKIFSPKAMDVRVLAPESLSALVMSPGAGVARIASPNAMNVLVLSPSFFTYGIWSGNRYVVQVLSPGILGIDAHPLLKP